MTELSVPGTLSTATPVAARAFVFSGPGRVRSAVPCASPATSSYLALPVAGFVQPVAGRSSARGTGRSRRRPSDRAGHRTGGPGGLIPRYPRTPFSVGFWAFTFTTAAGATYGVLVSSALIGAVAVRCLALLPKPRGFASRGRVLHG
ncbi:hypothetical protein [Streptomyces achromogenes]|uniref:hypothetical protein n=1 Tax=Streptomyces achromogenes TaxID=67255 RepID=UPI0036B70DB3